VARGGPAAGVAGCRPGAASLAPVLRARGRPGAGLRPLSGWRWARLGPAVPVVGSPAHLCAVRGIKLGRQLASGCVGIG